MAAAGGSGPAMRMPDRAVPRAAHDMLLAPGASGLPLGRPRRFPPDLTAGRLLTAWKPPCLVSSPWSSQNAKMSASRLPAASLTSRSAAGEHACCASRLLRRAGGTPAAAGLLLPPSLIVLHSDRESRNKAAQKGTPRLRTILPTGRDTGRRNVVRFPPPTIPKQLGPWRARPRPRKGEGVGI
jgi:hypothetical protein